MEKLQVQHTIKFKGLGRTVALSFLGYSIVRYACTQKVEPGSYADRFFNKASSRTWLEENKDKFAAKFESADKDVKPEGDGE